MKETNEFQHIGKETPYLAPAGFFETFPEKTLQKAINREQHRRKNSIRRLILSAAACLAFLLYLGIHFIQDSAPYSAPSLADNEALPAGKSTIVENHEPIKHMTDVRTKSAQSAKLEGKNLASKDKTEELNDVLSDLNDEELQLIAALYKTDPFINESLQ
ncbi:MAG: hypothetical protein M0R39_13195 [Prolixibacteraceae bacterium]|nr:hypothetical protein [Prolixibacteraceae bacterium]